MGPIRRSGAGGSWNTTVDDAERARHAGPGHARLKGGVVMVIGRAAHVLTALAAVGSVAVSVLGSAGATAAPAAAQSWTADPPGCWGPSGFDPDCLGPGPYGHGQWGPWMMGPAMTGPGPMTDPGDAGPDPMGPSMMVPGYRAD